MVKISLRLTNVSRKSERGRNKNISCSRYIEKLLERKPLIILMYDNSKITLKKKKIEILIKMGLLWLICIWVRTCLPFTLYLFFFLNL
jgi:hypothetical protein